MNPTDYVLYVDESYTRLPKDPIGGFPLKFLTMSGIILNNAANSFVEQELNSYKLSLFGRTDVILHTAEVNAFSPASLSKPGNQSFRDQIILARPQYYEYNDPKNFLGYHEKIQDIFLNDILKGTLLSSTININKYKDVYIVDDNRVHNVVFSNIIQMFAQFLYFKGKEHSSPVTGKIIYEDCSHISNFYETYTKLLAVGNITLEPSTFQQIKGLSFVDKEDNSNSLQLIDYVPSHIGNKHMLDYRLKNDSNFSQAQYDKEYKSLYIMKAIKSVYYSGAMTNRDLRPDIFGSNFWI